MLLGGRSLDRLKCPLDGDCFRERKVLTMCVLSKLASHDRVDIHYADGDVGPPAANPLALGT
jgi:hypothetical protein